MVTWISPSNFVYFSSTNTSESTLDTSHENIENVFSSFPTLSKVFATMLDVFDKFMTKTIPRSNESSLENPTNVLTMTSLIVTTTIQDSINLSQDVVASDDDDSTLPPWLFSNASKRKKQVASPKDFDFSQLVPIKLKTTKKAKTLSRVKVDK